MTNASLGTLRHVEVRQAWAHEARDFTPWLSENLEVLSAELGIALELEDTEVAVGPDQYRADILARAPHDGSVVLIENQLEEANLEHLGQVLAYLAGLNAQIVVWVATRFREGHLSAIRWLNEHTDDPFAFFAVRLSVVQIGDSQLAPVLNVLERPNEWDRQVERVSGLSDIAKFRRDFWTHFVSRRPDSPRLSPGYMGSNVWHWIEEAELYVVQYLAQNSVGVYLRGAWGTTKASTWPQLDPYVELLEKRLREAEAEDGYVRDSGHHWCVTTLRVDSRDTDNWDQMADWLDKRRHVYEVVLRADSGPAA
ncbi:MAG: hypothetical protein OXP73_11475 [Chloroflexota bacterium]|nr:hypothetical protein [Chloroflexota bacterium]